MICPSLLHLPSSALSQSLHSISPPPSSPLFHGGVLVLSVRQNSMGSISVCVYVCVFVLRDVMPPQVSIQLTVCGSSPSCRAFWVVLIRQTRGCQRHEDVHGWVGGV